MEEDDLKCMVRDTVAVIARKTDTDTCCFFFTAFKVCTTKREENLKHIYLFICFVEEYCLYFLKIINRHQKQNRIIDSNVLFLVLVLYHER